MTSRHLLRSFLTFVLIFTTIASPSAQTQTAAPDLAARLAAIEKTIEEKRKDLGVPGVAVAIVKDDKVVLQKGYGVRDIERNLPATADTLFAIGSCSKAFTAMAAVISQDEGKLSLDDSPKKHLSYFKLQDPEADAKITVRDLLYHSSGLDRTDLSWFTGVLTREEVIRVAGLAKPTAKFREKFQYQNTMYAAAGEVVARANKTTWEEYIAARFFKPLGMKSSNTSVKEMTKAADYAVGYDLTEKVATKAILRDLPNVAPAGAINSNVKDMSQWIRLMLGGGALEGKRLVSEKGFSEIVRKHMTIAGDTGYGLGWGLNIWQGHEIVAHSGGIDGFNSYVALMPDEKLGVVVLTNVSGSQLPAMIRDAVWNNFAGKPDAVVASAGSVPPQNEAGKYVLGALSIEVLFKDGKLRANVPGQPEYELINVGGRRYKLSSPAPDGFFMTFRPIQGKESETELYLEQPHGNYVVPKLKADGGKSPATASLPQYKELIGKYEINGVAMEIAAKDEKVVLVVPAQPNYTLVEKEKDKFGAMELPDSYQLTVKRNAAGEVTGFLMKQPEGEFEVKRTGGPAAAAKLDITVDELMAKAIAAAGGEASLRKYRSMKTIMALDFENQGLTGENIVYVKAPNLGSATTVLIGLGKKIGTLREYFDGAAGGTELSFAKSEPYKDKQIEDARIAFDFYEPLNWKTLYKTVTIKEKSKIGDEEAYVVVKTPEKGNPVTDYFSTKTFLLVKRDRTVMVGAGQGTMQIGEALSDYRNVEGVMVPFTTVTQHPSMGRIVGKVKEVKFDLEIPASAFTASSVR
ncbi:MAG: serine hydrolase domain-containing protein [Blastocatellia bacterium]